jgi:hypothetical protein
MGITEQRRERCDTCRHWCIYSPFSGPAIHGECHRFPPPFAKSAKEAWEPAIQSYASRAEWPTTNSGNFCGEWKCKEGAK